MIYDLRKMAINQVEQSEGKDIPQDWKTKDYEEIMQATREIMKYRKNQNFKLPADLRVSYSSIDKKSVMSTNYSSKMVSSRSQSHMPNFPYSSNGGTPQYANQASTNSASYDTANSKRGDRSGDHLNSLRNFYSKGTKDELPSSRIQKGDDGYQNEQD